MKCHDRLSGTCPAHIVIEKHTYCFRSLNTPRRHGGAECVGDVSNQPTLVAVVAIHKARLDAKLMAL